MKSCKFVSKQILFSIRKLLLNAKWGINNAARGFNNFGAKLCSNKFVVFIRRCYKKGYIYYLYWYFGIPQSYLFGKLCQIYVLLESMIKSESLDVKICGILWTIAAIGFTFNLVTQTLAWLGYIEYNSIIQPPRSHSDYLFHEWMTKYYDYTLGLGDGLTKNQRRLFKQMVLQKYGIEPQVMTDSWMNDTYERSRLERARNFNGTPLTEREKALFHFNWLLRKGPIDFSEQWPKPRTMAKGWDNKIIPENYGYNIQDYVYVHYVARYDTTYFYQILEKLVLAQKTFPYDLRKQDELLFGGLHTAEAIQEHKMMTDLIRYNGFNTVEVLEKIQTKAKLTNEILNAPLSPERTTQITAKFVESGLLNSQGHLSESAVYSLDKNMFMPRKNIWGNIAGIHFFRDDQNVLPEEHVDYMDDIMSNERIRFLSPTTGLFRKPVPTDAVHLIVNTYQQRRNIINAQGQPQQP